MRRVSQVPLPLCENSVAAQYQAAHTLLTFTTALLRLNGLDCIYMMEHFLVRDMSFFGGWEVSQGNPPPPPFTGNPEYTLIMNYLKHPGRHLAQISERKMPHLFQR